MNMRTVASRAVAALLILALQLTYGPALVAAPMASLSGRVLSADSQKPLAGALVHVGDPRTGAIRSSQPTAADGSFSVSGLPAASYQLAIQSGAGMYIVPSAVPLGAGESRNVQLAVQAQTTAPSPQEAMDPKMTNYDLDNNQLYYSFIEIADTGSGILPQNLEKIFNPFFTTKPNGLGLGLPICSRLVGENGGNLDEDSKAGHGTKITLALPAFVHHLK